MSNVKFQSRQTESTEASTVYALTYFGPKSDMDALAAGHTIGESGGAGYGNGRLRSIRVSQSSPGVWECELRYEANHDKVVVTPPERGYGVKLTTLHGAALSRPLECHPNYLAHWNHYLFAAPDVTVSPAWALTATDTLIAATDAQKFAWGKSLGECPISPSGERWLAIVEPAKKGVDSYDVATYTISETVRCTSRNAAGGYVAGKLNRIGAPGTTLGITGGNWKCDDAEVSWNGRCWIARLTWTRSGDDDGWDTDLYQNVSS